MEQYVRRENIRIHGVPESTGNRDDGEMVVLEIAKKTNVNLESGDIQHRLGWHKNIELLSTSTGVAQENHAKA